MFEILLPDQYYPDIFSIEGETLHNKGIEGIICDVDNTIVPYDKKILKPEVENWFFHLKEQQFKICLVSNSLRERVNFFSKKLKVPAVEKAVKPRKKPFYKAIKILNLKREKIVVIGDQIFTDIWGGNRVGLKTILVNPMERQEFIFTRIVRKFEKIIFTRKY